MKIIITADIHNDLEKFKKLVQIEKVYDYWFDLGDSMFDDDFLEKYNIIGVKGNADSNNLLEHEIIDLDGHRFFLTHGHLEGAYYSLNNMYFLAKEKNCDVTFYGHTHLPKIDKINDVQFINPGSLRTTRTYVLYIDNEIFLKKI